MSRGIASSLMHAFGSLLSLRVIWLMVWPVLAALAVWGIAALFLWMRTAVWLGGVLKGWIESAVFFASVDFGSTALVAAHVVLFLLFVPLVYLTAILILGLFGMDELVDIVAARRFPDLKARAGGGVAGNLAGSLWNSLVALAGMLVLFAISLPLWIFPPLWPVIPVAVMGWANQRLLRYDALARHAQPLEIKSIFAARRMPLYWLGVALALMAYVPIIGFFAPVLFGLAFIHYLLAELKALREAPIEGVVTGRE
ncbi:MAG: EI24 domain-containing protein [Betaproteobacteria bacterium]|nr:EI24 domain-containing protein [Betaproteobacteria bacterium]